MAKINDSVFTNWNDGETIKAGEYKQERSIIQTAINDNYDRLIKNYKVLDASGNTKTTQALDTAINYLNFKDSSTVILSLDNTTSTLELAVIDGSITTSKLQDLGVTTSKIANGNVTTVKIADLNVTRDKLADNSVNLQKLDLVDLDSRYYTESELDNGQLDNRYYTEGEVNNFLGGKADVGDSYTKGESDSKYTYLSGNHQGTWQGLNPGEVSEAVNGGRLDVLEPKVATLEGYNLDTRVTSIESNLSEQDQETKELIHGINTIFSDMGSSLKVEFYGTHRINYADGNFDNQNNWGSNFTIDTSVYKFGSSSGKIDNSAGTGALASLNSRDMQLNGEYILFGIWMKSTSGTPAVKVGLTGRNSDASLNENFLLTTTVNSTWTFYYIKIDLSAKSIDHYNLYLQLDSFGTNDDVVYFDGGLIEKISNDTYNKIGVSLTDVDVERLFPYVDSIKGISNPYVKVSGANLLPPFTEWTLHANAKVISPYELEFTPTTTGYKENLKWIDVVGNQSVYLNVETSAGLSVVSYDANNTQLTVHLNKDNTNLFQGIGFTTPSNAKKIKVNFFNPSGATGTFTFKQPMLNLGSTALPFVEKNDSYVYAETSLYGNDNKKDILSHNESANQWEINPKWFEKKALSGSDSWAFQTDYVGYKRVKLLLSSALGNQFPEISKYNGSIIQKNSSYSTGDQAYINGDPNLFITISDTDSGWTDAMTPTADMIKGYFNGWKYTGDGTTHTWASIVDGTTAPATQTAAFVADPANTPTGYENYFLLYELQEPVTEPVTVEGDLSIQGDAQVEVSEGVIVREEVVPYDLGNGMAQINHKTYSPLSNKAMRITSIYKDTSEDNTNWTITTSSNAYGDVLAYADIENVDLTKRYTLTYEVLDKYDFTTNLTEVKATFANSIKSSFQQQVEKTSDIATTQSIHAKQIYDLIIKTKNL